MGSPGVLRTSRGAALPRRSVPPLMDPVPSLAALVQSRRLGAERLGLRRSSDFRVAPWVEVGR
eukprot:9480462-Pyramimonas_sp.AAC.1